MILETILRGADRTVTLQDMGWVTVRGRTADLGKIYEKIYQEGRLKYEIERFRLFVRSRQGSEHQEGRAGKNGKTTLCLFDVPSVCEIGHEKEIPRGRLGYGVDPLWWERDTLRYDPLYLQGNL